MLITHGTCYIRALHVSYRALRHLLDGRAAVAVLTMHQTQVLMPATGEHDMMAPPCDTALPMLRHDRAGLSSLSYSCWK